MPFRPVNFKIKPRQKITNFLAQKLSLDYNYIQRLFDTNRIMIDDNIVKNKTLFHEGDITVELFIPQSKGCRPIFETKDFFLFDKPSGVHIHPQINYSGYTLLDEIRHFGGQRANPVHRLDRETSGLLLCGKNHGTTKALKSLFEMQQVTKRYLALVHNKVSKPMTIDAPIKTAHDFTKCKHKVKISQEGKAAKTFVKPLYYNSKNNTTLVQLTPYSGRTHQLRVHMFHVEHPIVGDPLYGASFEFSDRYLDGKVYQSEREKYLGSKRLMLHAHSLSFIYKNRYTIISQCSTWNTP
ncbi:MAG: RluA family pseudouridine synthase [Campylobacterota bacterium]